MICVGKQLYFTTESAAKTVQQELCMLNSAHFVEVGGSSTPTASGDLHISVIHAFCESMRATIESRPDQPIVICPENHDIRVRTSGPETSPGRNHGVSRRTGSTVLGRPRPL